MLGLSSVALAKERQVYYDTRHDPSREFHEQKYSYCRFGFDPADCLGRNAADLAVRILDQSVEQGQDVGIEALFSRCRSK